MSQGVPLPPFEPALTLPASVAGVIWALNAKTGRTDTDRWEVFGLVGESESSQRLSSGAAGADTRS